MTDHTYIPVEDLPSILSSALGALDPHPAVTYPFEIAYLILKVRHVPRGIRRKSWDNDTVLGIAFGELMLKTGTQIARDFRLGPEDLEATDWVVLF